MTRQLLYLLLLVAVLSGCIGTDKEELKTTVSPTPPTAIPTPVFTVPEPYTVYVEIYGSEFKPLELRVTNGTTVRWTNLDSAEYIINVDNHSSPLLGKKSAWNYTFNKTGIFTYNSSTHPRMSPGSIIVTRT